MEILSNFISIHCLISFLIGAVLMMFALGIVSVCKDKEPRNKVRFFVKVVYDNIPWLFIQKKDGTLKLIFTERCFAELGLSFNDFADIKKGEIREVFINLED